MIDFKKKMQDKADGKVPANKPFPPPLETGFTRIRLRAVLTSTEKAVRVQLDDGIEWIPKSVCKIHQDPRTGNPINDVIDIKNDFYDKNLYA